MSKQMTKENETVFQLEPETIEARNINPSAYRVLYILLLLVRQKSLNIDEINEYLSKHPQISRSYNTETMLKYMNTLRKSGCKIPRVSKKNEYRYQLLNNPVPLMLTQEEIDIALEVESLLQTHSDKSLVEAYQQFLSEVIWALPKEHAQAIEGQRQLPSKQLSAKRRKKTESKRVGKFQQYCKDEQLLEVSLLNALHLDETLVKQIEPYELVTGHGGKENEEVYYLIGYDTLLQKNIKLDISKIVSERQLPSKIRREQTSTQVMFQLYGRLAKSYRAYPDEEVMLAQGDTLQILATTSDPDALLSRLMKYGTSCQVLAPMSLRQAMRQRIKVLMDGMAASV